MNAASGFSVYKICSPAYFQRTQNARRHDRQRAFCMHFFVEPPAETYILPVIPSRHP